jgi:signal transduction histidine kinase
MSEAPAGKPAVAPQEETPERETTIRGQLLWAALFPLAFFILLAILVITTMFHQFAVSMVLRRNTALAQASAAALHQAAPADAPGLVAAQVDDAAIGFYWMDKDGQVLASANSDLPTEMPLFGNLQESQTPQSRMTQSPGSGEEYVVSFAPLAEDAGSLFLVEPWKGAIAGTTYMEAVLIVLIALGAAFALYTLSLSIGRVMRPITEMVGYARKAVPGSLFRPMPEEGPAELRTLIKSFNQMVVRLAEQQNNLRQYAHKALLSQEEERQRLSHELHDGTMQDLVGLVQRVELCRNEMEKDPLMARHRLDELHQLLEETLRDVRQISNALRPSILEDLGLPAALHSLCNDLEQQMPATHCHFGVKGQERRLTADLELAVFRVVQEALSNIRKHARQATSASVELIYQEAGIEARISNNGPAFPIPNVRNLVRNGHLGLAGMYERARLFRGQLNISSDPVNNTVVHLRLPYPPEGENI